jgi:hypothetical protein
VKNGYAISLVTGFKFRYGEEKWKIVLKKNYWKLFLLSYC